MGLDLGDDFCYDNVSRIVRQAAEQGNFVRIDMEGSPYTDRTLAIYRRLRRQFGNAASSSRPTCSAARPTSRR